MGTMRLAILFAIGAVCSAQQPPTATGATRLVRARISDAFGKPLANAGAVFGAPTEVSTTDALQKPMARSSIDGVLELSLPVESELRTLLLIAAPGRVAFLYPNPHQRSPWIRSSSGAVDLGEIRLPNAHVMTGRVRDAAGKPIVGARVHAVDGLVQHLGYSPSYGSQVFTDANGVFRLVCVFANAMRVSVSAEGFFARPLMGVGIGAPLDIVLKQSGFVEGTVRTADGKPASGTVGASHEFVASSMDFAPIVDGRFRISLNRPGRLRVNAFGRTGAFLAQSDVLDGPAQGVDLRVGNADEGTFAVRAEDATGKAIPTIQASVCWYQDTREDHIESMLRDSLSSAGEDGAVRLDPPGDGEKGPGVLHVRAAGYAPLFVDKVAFRVNGSFVAKLVGGARVAGKVVEPGTGRPIAGAVVTCRRTAATQVEGGWWELHDEPCTTDALGAFAFEQLEAGPYLLQVRHAGGTIETTRSFTLAAGEARSDEVLELAAGVAVRGRFSGALLDPGCLVVLAKEDPVQSTSSYGMSSGLVEPECPGSVPVVDGAFVLPHRAAGTEDLWLVVRPPPRQGAFATIRLRAVEVGAEDVALEIDLAGRMPGTLRGKVETLGAEVPVCRLVVVITPKSEKNERSWQASPAPGIRWALVEPDGAFVIPLPAGDYEVSVIDSVTGMRLLADESVAIAAATTVTKALRVRVAEVRVQLEHEPGDPLSVSRLSVLPPDQRREGYLEQALFGGGIFGDVGLDVTTPDATLVFFVPPGDHGLRLGGGATHIGRGGVSFAYDGDAVRVTAEPGVVNEVTLQMPLPKDLGGK